MAVTLALGVPVLAAAASGVVSLLGRLPEVLRESSIKRIAEAAARSDRPLAPDDAATIIRSLTPGDDGG
jgi:hypothetical protein